MARRSIITVTDPTTLARQHSASDLAYALVIMRRAGLQYADVNVRIMTAALTERIDTIEQGTPNPLESGS